MNQCYFSYCLKMGCGGIHLKYKNIKVMKHITFLLDDTIRPGAVFDLDGALLYVNDSFRKEFVYDGKGNIKELFYKIDYQFLGLCHWLYKKNRE